MKQLQNNQVFLASQHGNEVTHKNIGSITARLTEQSDLAHYLVKHNYSVVNNPNHPDYQKLDQKDRHLPISMQDIVNGHIKDLMKLSKPLSRTTNQNPFDESKRVVTAKASKKPAPVARANTPTKRTRFSSAHKSEGNWKANLLHRLNEFYNDGDQLVFFNRDNDKTKANTVVPRQTATMVIQNSAAPETLGNWSSA